MCNREWSEAELTDKNSYVEQSLAEAKLFVFPNNAAIVWLEGIVFYFP